MPSGTFTADQIIGLNLTALKEIPLYRNVNPTGTAFAKTKKGETVGTVYSWVGGNNGVPLYWMFYGTDGKAFYAKHEPDTFDFFKGNILTVQEKAAIEKKKLEIEEKGKFLYYFEKYGKFVIFSVIGVVIFKEIMKRKFK